MTSNYDINRRRPDVRFNRTKKDFSEVMIHATDKQFEKIVRKAVNDSAKEMRKLYTDDQSYIEKDENYTSGYYDYISDQELDEAFNKEFYEGFRSTIFCQEHGTYASVNEVKQFARTLLIKEREKAKQFMYDKLGLPMQSPNGGRNEFERWLDEHYE